MIGQDITLVISVITGITSVIMAGFAIWLGKSSERESKANFERTQTMMLEYNEKTKEVLAEIDKRATVIEKTVSESQQHLLNTVTSLLSQTAIPTKADLGEQFAMQLMQTMMQDPTKGAEVLERLQPFIDLAEKQTNSRERQ